MAKSAGTRYGFMVLLAAGLFAACGGSESNEGGNSSGEGDSGGGGLPLCGNGLLDEGETCDGAVYRGGATCSAATMGSRPTGSLSCVACLVNSSACTSAATGAGGAAPGVGGSPGTGGTGGPGTGARPGTGGGF